MNYKKSISARGMMLSRYYAIVAMTFFPCLHSQVDGVECECHCHGLVQHSEECVFTSKPVVSYIKATKRDDCLSLVPQNAEAVIITGGINIRNELSRPNVKSLELMNVMNECASIDVNFLGTIARSMPNLRALCVQSDCSSYFDLRRDVDLHGLSGLKHLESVDLRIRGGTFLNVSSLMLLPNLKWLSLAYFTGPVNIPMTASKSNKLKHDSGHSTEMQRDVLATSCDVKFGWETNLYHDAGCRAVTLKSTGGAVAQVTHLPSATPFVCLEGEFDMSSLGCSSNVEFLAWYSNKMNATLLDSLNLGKFPNLKVLILCFESRDFEVYDIGRFFRHGTIIYYDISCWNGILANGKNFACRKDAFRYVGMCVPHRLKPCEDIRPDEQ